MFEDGQTAEQFFNDYYTVGYRGYMEFMGRINQGAEVRDSRDALMSDLKKILIAEEANYYENAYMQQVQLQFSWLSALYAVLDKRSLMEIGDSFKHTSAHGLAVAGIQPGGATAFFGTATEPTLATVTKILSPISHIPLSRSLDAMLHEKLDAVRQGGSDWSWITKDLAPKALANYIDTWLGGYESASAVHGVDTPATVNPECIDRLISDGPESGDGTSHVSAVTDGDVFWNGLGTGTAKIDKSEGSAAWSDSYVKLPDSAGTEQNYQIMEEIDDMMKAIKPHSVNKRYAIFTTMATLNKVQNEYLPGHRTTGEEVNVEIGVNGLKTYAGHDIGFPVRSITSCGVKMPVFTMESLPTLNSVYTTATAGHLYAVDLDELFLRIDLPITYLETGFGAEMIHQNAARSRALLFTVFNLINKRPQTCGKITWIKA